MNLPRSTFWICMACVCMSTGLTCYIFAASRQDPGLRMAALVGATNIATALMATASTLLTGKDLSGRRDPADIPAGAVQTETNTTTIAAPPVAPAVADAITPAPAANPTQ